MNVTDPREATYSRAPEPTTVAIAYHPATGEVYDECWGWETGENLANQGYRVVAVADDGAYWTMQRCQELYDREARLFADCWGRNTPFDVD